MRNCYVMTRHAIRNYGSVLQTYATTLVLETMDRQPQIIDYRQEGVDDTARSYRQRGSGPAGALKDGAYRMFRARDARARGAVFERFLATNLQLTERQFASYEELLAYEGFSSNSTYCVGSDQVWNIEYNCDNRPYYLDFVPGGATKFSLSSSIGMSELPRHEERKLVESLSEFRGVSVREKTAEEYLRSLGIDALQHLDPTMLVNAEQWRTFAAGVPARPQPYLLVYQLNASDQLQKAALAIGRVLQLPVVRIEYWCTFRGRGAETILRPSLKEFIGLFRDASFVVTDSFHGSAFSINFGIPLTVIEPPQYSLRLTSLLEQFGVESRRANSIGDAVEIARTRDDRPFASEILDSERSRAIAYLNNVLTS